VADLEIAVRDHIGRAIRSTGGALHDVGLGLCGLAGWWDARTDSVKMSKWRRRG
jgi:hypothetical protein